MCRDCSEERCGCFYGDLVSRGLLARDSLRSRWPGAYDHAGVKLGLPNSNGAMGPILPGTSLEAITGKKATGNLRITADAIFDLAVKSASAKTPAILQTKGDNVRTLVGNHAYTLLSGEGTGAGRK